MQIRLKIAEKEYTLKTTPEEEATLRQAGKQINEQIRQLQKRTGIWDKQDLLVMVAFDCIVQQIKHNQADRDHHLQVDAMSTAIEQALKGDWYYQSFLTPLPYPFLPLIYKQRLTYSALAFSASCLLGIELQ